MGKKYKEKRGLERLQLWKKENPWCRFYYGAKARCNDPKEMTYYLYGGRGIKFLLLLKDFEFLWKRDKADKLKRPSIDRIDSNADYSLDNCRFIELSENCSKGGKKGNQVRWGNANAIKELK